MNDIKLDPLVIGAAYALIKGDLETAYQLGIQSIQKDPYSVESYVVLSYAFSGLGNWTETAHYSRLALAFGATDERLGSLITGLYQYYGFHEEAEWIENRCHCHALDLSMALDTVEASEIKIALTSHLNLPKVHSHHQGSHQPVTQEVKKDFSWGSQTYQGLPEWLEHEVGVNDHLGAGDYNARPDWLGDVSDSIDDLFQQQTTSLPDWLEQNETFINFQAVDHTTSLKQNGAVKNSTLDANSVQQKQGEKTHFLNDGEAQAKSLGLGEEFQVAVELEALTLLQDNARPKRLFGPLLLAISGSRLILAAYEGEELRQRPWAFNKGQIMSIQGEQSKLQLFMEEGRNISFEVGSATQAEQLVISINHWRLTQR